MGRAAFFYCELLAGVCGAALQAAHSAALAGQAGGRPALQHTPRPNPSLSTFPACLACPRLPADQPDKPGPPVLALYNHGAGRVGLYGDSNCLDSSHSRSKCFKLLTAMLTWAAGGVSCCARAGMLLRCRRCADGCRCCLSRRGAACIA